MTGPSDAVGRSSAGFSLEEMKAIAAEAGLDPVLVERAARQIPVESRVSWLQRVLGGSVKYRLDAHLRTKLTDESAAHLLSAVRAAVEQQGVGEADSSGLLWNSAGHQVLVSAHAEGDGTRVRVVVDRRASLAVTGALSVLGAFAFAVAVVASGETGMLESVPLGVSMIVAGAAGSLALGRAAWASSAREIRQRVGSLMDAVGPLLAQTASGSAAFEEAAAEDGEADAMRTDEGAS